MTFKSQNSSILKLKKRIHRRYSTNINISRNETIFHFSYSIVFLLTGFFVLFSHLPDKPWKFSVLEKWFDSPPKQSLVLKSLLMSTCVLSAFQAIFIIRKWWKSFLPTNLTIGYLLLRVTVSVVLLCSAASGLDGLLLLTFLLLYELPQIPSLCARLFVEENERLSETDAKLFSAHFILFVATRILAALFFNGILIPFAKIFATKFLALLFILVSISSGLFQILSRLRKTRIYNLLSLL
ncbi:hypothetical protein MHBO_003443 [Bonamia ostreae]|uniref:Uncharacterized protein n=1 Tax=Bonamia ostreae TaxID=126728 RepID=A0ABV2AQG8_9EUKA